MCDTMVALPADTAEGITLFGKNSDRYRNEAHIVELQPRSDHAPGVELRCTYISIPQVARTHAVVLCRPFWIWGAEMGANEHGVVIGNEGVRARSPSPEREALIGMDLLRLALERAYTAEDAIRVMTQLLEEFGQGGNCGHLKPSYYNNSYIVADRKEGYVLETIGRDWVLEKIEGVRSISNVYSIEGRVERVSDGLRQVIEEAGWSTEGTGGYASLIGDPQSQHIGHSGARWTRSTQLLQRRAGHLRVEDVASILRDHGLDEVSPADWHPAREKKRTLCLHAGASDAPAQTTGSLVSELHATEAVHWVTGTAAPCISIFRPMLLDAPLPSHGPPPSDQYDGTSLWWSHERLHRAAVVGDFGHFLHAIADERDALEAELRRRVHDVLKGGSMVDRAEVVRECWELAEQAERRWQTHITSCDVTDRSYIEAWEEMNRLAGLDIHAHAKVNAS